MPVFPWNLRRFPLDAAPPRGTMAATMAKAEPHQQPPLSHPRRAKRLISCRPALLALFLLALCSSSPFSRAAPAENTTLESPGFRAVFDRASGALRELKCDRWLVSFSGSGGQLLAEDFPNSPAKVLITESCRLAYQRLKVRYRGPDLACELEWRIENGMLRANGRLENQTGRDRALVLTYELPWAQEGLRFSPSLNSLTSASDQATSGSVYPLAAMCGTNAAAALAISPSAPNMFKVVGDRGKLGLRLYLGLSPDTHRAPNAASFSFVAYGCDPAWGFRDALRRYYAAFPEYYTHHGRGDGLWMFKTSQPRNLAQYKYDETFALGDLDPSIQRDHAAGVLTFPYMIVGQREVKHLGTLPADYDQAMAAYDRWTPAGTNAARPTKESVAAGDDVHLKEEVASSALKDAAGRYVITIRKSSWSGNSVTFVTNPNPHLMEDKPGARSTGAEALARIHEWLARYPAVDGIYIDSLGRAWCGKLDPRRDHFPYTRYPLTFDSAGRLAIHNVIAHYEFLEQLRAELHSQKRLLFANGVYLYAAKQPEYADVRETGRFFLASLLDVAGSESGVRPSIQRWEFFRACMGPKPYLLLNYYWTNAALVETYLNQALCYDVFAVNSNLNGDYASDPQGYARDRKLFDWFVPLARTLSKAGWQPVTHAMSTTPGLRFERYGAGGEIFFTLYNPGVARECVLRIDKPPLSLGPAAHVEQISGPGLAAVEQDAASITVRTKLAAERTAVISIR
jgi:hypothetical protein